MNNYDSYELIIHLEEYKYKGTHWLVLDDSGDSAVFIAM